MNKDSGILVENYSSLEKKAFEAYLISVKDSIEVFPVNVFFRASNLQKIHPSFKKAFFLDMEESLKWNQNDSTKLLENTFICMGVFDGKEFEKYDSFDEKLLNNRFFRSRK